MNPGAAEIGLNATDGSNGTQSEIPVTEQSHRRGDGGGMHDQTVRPAVPFGEIRSGAGGYMARPKLIRTSLGILVIAIIAGVALTVIGMVAEFNNAANEGTVDEAALSKDVGRAMIWTAAMVPVAIVGLCLLIAGIVIKPKHEAPRADMPQSFANPKHSIQLLNEAVLGSKADHPVAVLLPFTSESLGSKTGHSRL